MPDTLRQKMIRGTSWSFFTKIINQVIQFVGSIIMARLLLPEHFGLIAMISLIPALSQSLVNSGLSISLVQKTKVDNDDLSTIFFYNLFVAIVLALIFYFCAVPISKFYSEPKLIPLIRLLSISIIIFAFSIIQRVQLRRKLDYKGLFFGEIIGAIIGFSSGIFAALNGMGVYSIVIHLLVSPTVVIIILWIQTKWMPVLRFSIQKFKQHWAFSSNLLFSSIVNSIFMNAYNILIGKFYSPSQLGVFSKGRTIQNQAIYGIITAFDSVVFAGLSKIKEDNELLKKAFKKIIKIICLFTFPIMAILAASSDNFITVLLGEKWIESSFFLQWLCIAGIFYPLSMLNMKIPLIKGKTKLFFKIEIIKKIAMTLLFLFAILYNHINAFLIIIILQRIFDYLIVVYYTNSIINYGLIGQIKDVLNILLISLLTFIITLYMRNIANQAFINLAIQVVVGITVYFLGIILFLKSYFYEVKNYFKEIRRGGRI